VGGTKMTNNREMMIKKLTEAIFSLNRAQLEMFKMQPMKVRRTIIKVERNNLNEPR